jgi:hypothetical protein
MKQTIFERVVLTVLLLIPFAVFSQVGIGTSSVNASAKLQVDATSQGFLPRVLP